MDARRTLGIVGALRASRKPLRGSRTEAATEYLIQDPHHLYAAHLIRHLHSKFGFRAVCFYTDRRDRLYHQDEFPILRSECVAASYDVRTRELAEFAAHLATTHNIAAVLPFNEPTLAPAVELARLLQLDWEQTQVMRRFHDKFALKDHIRRTHPEVAMNASCRVATLAEILAARRESCYQQFVLKPNSGYGNRSIGLFDADTAQSTLRSWLEQMTGTSVVMEQYIGGAEYFVNGQIDGQGTVTVIAIFEYVRLPANGRHNIDSQTRLVPHADPRFATLAGYATQVMAATGLRRSPFHLEVKGDGDGQRLIEVGARLAGHANAILCGELHGNGLDLFVLAAHYYFKADGFGSIPLDWAAYDSRAVRYVHGVARERTRIITLEGVHEVQSLPEFHAWVKQPRVGDMLEPTRDILSMPFSLILRGDSEAALDAAAGRINEILQINRTSPAARGLAVNLACQTRRVARSARIRLQSFAASAAGPTQPLQHNISAARLSHATVQSARHTLARVRRRAQLLEVGRARPQPPQKPSADSGDHTQTVLQWASQYLGRPHPRLGRPGAVCPFVRPSIDAQRLRVKCYDDAGEELGRLRKLVLWEAREFGKVFPRHEPNAQLSSVVLAFPAMTDDCAQLLDVLHDDLKTHLIVRHGLMTTPFHPRSVKPSITNPEFTVFRGPLPMFVLRHIDVRDIAFIGSNEAAFRRYYDLFCELFERREVSNEFGHVSAYLQACERFNFPVRDELSLE